MKKITLHSSYGQFTDSILGKQIGNEKTIKLKCPQKGEGTFSICAFTNKDTLCSKDNYIEEGYRPRLKLKNNKFVTIEWNWQTDEIETLLLNIYPSSRKKP